MTGKVEGIRENMERNLFVITLIMKKKTFKKRGPQMDKGIAC